MTILNQHFTLYAGEDKVIPCAVVDGAGAAYNLTGATIRWSASYRPSTGALISKSSPASGITITNAAGGLFEINFDAADTDIEAFIANSDSGEVVFYHYCKVQMSGGEKSVIFEGVLTLKNNPLKTL